VKIKFDKNLSGWIFSCGFGYDMGFIYIGRFMILFTSNKKHEEFEIDKRRSLDNFECEKIKAGEPPDISRTTITWKDKT